MAVRYDGLVLRGAAWRVVNTPACTCHPFAGINFAHFSDFDHYVQDLVHFSKVVLPAAISPSARGGDSDGGGGHGGAVDVAEGELPCRNDDDGDALRLKLSVVAHSMGGLIAVNAALEEPLLFEGVRRYQPLDC